MLAPLLRPAFLGAGQVLQRHHPHQSPLIVEHGEAVVPRGVEERLQFLQRGRFGDRIDIGRHHLLDLDVLEDIHIAPALPVDAAPRQLERVDGIAAQRAGDDGAHARSQHQREDEAVVARHLEDDEHRRQRGVRGTGEDGGHPHQRVGSHRPQHVRGQDGVDDVPEGSAEHRAHKEARRKDAAGVPRSQGDVGGDHLGEDERRHQPQREPSGQRKLDGGEARPQRLRHPVAEHAQQQPAQRRFPGIGDEGELLLGEVLRRVERGDEEPADDGGQQAEEEVEQQFTGMTDAVGGDEEGRRFAQVVAADDARRYRRDDDGGEVGGGELPAQDDLQREDDPGDGRVEGRRDARRRAAGHQVADEPFGKVEHLADDRA